VSEHGPQSDTTDLRTQLRRLERRATRRRGQVERLRAQVGILSDEVRSPLERTVGESSDPELSGGIPSYSLAARLHRRANTTDVNVSEGVREPILQLYPKLPAQRFAALHGVPVPRVLGQWSDPDAIDWDSLPDRFVLKSNVGGGGMNVFPLARNPRTGTYTDLLVEEPTTRADVTEVLWARHEDRSLYFAEEFLVSRTGDADAVPSDVKVFCFYGEAVYVEVRRGDQSRAKEVTSRARSYTAEGAELVNVRALIDPGEGDIDALDDLRGVVEAAARLSAAIRRPLERLDFFETDRGLVFGEVTQNPGHLPALVPEWDRRLGEAYERAYARLLRDLAAEDALHVDFGIAAPDAPP
jgi:hypothetical protein